MLAASRKTSSVVAGLDDLALPHDGDLVGDAGDHREVVGDEDHPHAVLVDELLQQLQELRPGW